MNGMHRIWNQKILYSRASSRQTRLFPNKCISLHRLGRRGLKYDQSDESKRREWEDNHRDILSKTNQDSKGYYKDTISPYDERYKPDTTHKKFQDQDREKGGKEFSPTHVLIFATFLGGYVYCMKDSIQDYNTISNTLKKDPRIYEVTQEKLKSDVDHKFKVVPHKDDSISYEYLEELILPLTRDLKHDKNKEIGALGSAIFLTLNGLNVLFRTDKNPKRSKSSPWIPFLCIAGIMVGFIHLTSFKEVFKLPNLKPIKSRDELLESNEGNKKTRKLEEMFLSLDNPVYLDEYIKIMPYEDYLIFLEEVEEERRRRQQEMQNAKRQAERTAALRELNNSDSDISSGEIHEDNHPSSSWSSNIDSDEHHVSSRENRASTYSRPSYESPSLQSDKERRMREIDYEINQLEHAKMEARRRQLEDEIKRR